VQEWDALEICLRAPDNTKEPITEDNMWERNGVFLRFVSTLILWTVLIQRVSSTHLIGCSLSPVIKFSFSPPKKERKNDET